MGALTDARRNHDGPSSPFYIQHDHDVRRLLDLIAFDTIVTEDSEDSRSLGSSAPEDVPWLRDLDDYERPATLLDLPRRDMRFIFGNSSSLVFPTSVDPPADSLGEGSNLRRRHKINLLLDRCETTRFPFKKKLILDNMGLRDDDVPVGDLYGTRLGYELHKLSLAGNHLTVLSHRLVTCLPVLNSLDLSQCDLQHLPERWNLPQLKKLNLSYNRLTEFPNDVSVDFLLGNGGKNGLTHSMSCLVLPSRSCNNLFCSVLYIRLSWKVCRSFKNSICTPTDSTEFCCQRIQSCWRSYRFSISATTIWRAFQRG